MKVSFLVITYWNESIRTIIAQLHSLKKSLGDKLKYPHHFINSIYKLIHLEIDLFSLDLQTYQQHGNNLEDKPHPRDIF